MSSLTENIKKLEHYFTNCETAEDRYRILMDLGKGLTLDPKYHTAAYLVPGCQSLLYLRSYLVEGKLYFEAKADALISSGLAAVLILAYQGLAPEEILQANPTFLEKLKIASSLSPSRSNGLSNIYIRMKQEALKYLFEKKQESFL